MRKALYPGTFDPVTIGHMDIIERAAKLYDELIIAIMVNPRKKCTFDSKERKALIEKCIRNLPNVRVVIGDGLTVDLADREGCNTLIRGIRAVADYEYELAQATANLMLNNRVETLFMVARPEYSFLSSSIAKEIAIFDGDITNFIPEEIKKEVYDRLYINKDNDKSQ